MAYSCKWRGVCPGCNTRRMVETAAHMVEHVFPAVAVRQWVAAIAMREVQRATAGASTGTAAAFRSGGVLFVHRFGATLNAHVHLHLCMRACGSRRRRSWRRSGTGLCAESGTSRRPPLRHQLTCLGVMNKRLLPLVEFVFGLSARMD